MPVDASELPPARVALLRFMEWWSEDRWCAGWLTDLEHELVANTSDPDHAAFRWLVGQAGGWWTYSDTGEEFVPGTFEQLAAAAEHRRRAS